MLVRTSKSMEFGAFFCVLLASLVALVGAGRQSDVSLRKGFTKQFVERSAPVVRATNETTKRFYNNDTARKVATFY